MSLVMILMTSSIAGYVYWWGGIFGILILTAFEQSHIGLQISPIKIAILLFSSVLLVNIFFINPVFHPECLYFVAYLVVPFLFFNLLSKDHFFYYAKIIISVFAILSVWGIFQYLTKTGYIIDMNGRANAIFHTPNTFAAALNLILLPLIIHRLFKYQSIKFDSVIFLLFFALLTTQSRGGWISFIVTLFFSFSLLVLTKNIKIERSTILVLSTLAVLTVLFFMQHTITNRNSSINLTSPATIEKDIAETQPENTIKEVRQLSSFAHRLILYEIAWNRIKEKPLLGHGYFNFQYFQVRDKPKEILNYGKTNFVHNDYLQYFLETGLLGLNTFIFLIITFYWRALNIIRHADTNTKWLCISISTGITSYIIHASGDFVLYPLTLLFLFGSLLGFIDRIDNEYKNKLTDSPMFTKQYLMNKKLEYFLIFTLTIYLLKPVIAETFENRAKYHLDNLDIEKTLKYYQYARRLTPYNPDYYYQEAKLWLKAVDYENSADAAEISDHLLKKGHNLNPYEKQILLTRSILHRDYSYLLNTPVGIDTILSWQKEVLLWRPHDPLAQTEYIKSLFKAGEHKEAVYLTKTWLADYPNNNLLKQFISESINDNKIRSD